MIPKIKKGDRKKNRKAEVRQMSPFDRKELWRIGLSGLGAIITVILMILLIRGHIVPGFSWQRSPKEKPAAKTKVTKVSETGCQILKTIKTPFIRIDINKGCFELDKNYLHVGALFRNGYTPEGLADLRYHVYKTFGHVKIRKILERKVRFNKHVFYILSVYRVMRM